MNGTLLRDNRHAYITVGYSMKENSALEDGYTRIVMTIRDIFGNGTLPSSNRWYLET